jgi:hypothetical protein
MKKITDLVGRELTWVQPHALKMHFELRDADEVAAELRFRSSLGSHATAESGDGKWTFKRVGFWQAKATVREFQSETDIAEFRNNTWASGGTLVLPDGRQFKANSNFWMTEYGFETEAGEPLVKYRRIRGVLHVSAQVEIGASRLLREMPWLASFGWYLAVLMHSDAAGAAAAAGAG